VSTTTTTTIEWDRIDINALESLRFHALNIGNLSSRSATPLFTPCTPAGVLHLLSTIPTLSTPPSSSPSNISHISHTSSPPLSLSGLSAVVLGRSDIVGNPLSALLRRANATVTQAHSHTPLPTLQAALKTADIVVCAVGKAEFVRGEWLKGGVVVVDVGTNYVKGECPGSPSLLPAISYSIVPLEARVV
jgi:methylenetetrahydrofolate dehydrogenase (NADP+) / methenyltetrahydrofolate cyclohydrolase / formyltetrahydrofolate synthetase